MTTVKAISQMTWTSPSVWRFRDRVLIAVVMAMLLGAELSIAWSQTNQTLPKLHTNEQYVDDLTEHGTLNIDDVKSVFSFVLGSLPDRVRVYPTENYYYFYFYQRGIKYAGNLRFDVEARDKGLLSFAYFKDTTGWHEDESDHHALLGPDDGVALEKIGDLVYQVRLGGKSVTFELNDLSAVKPPPSARGEDEDYLGPVFDESGLRFFLMFDRKLKVFHYVLDETIPVNDELISVPDLKHFLIGRRTGFAFHTDREHSRRILIAVYGPNVDVNNYLDGPFDQLPDNFIKGEALKHALVLAKPGIENKIDRFGISMDGESRESIAPYIEYEMVGDLAKAEQCAMSGSKSPVYLCLEAVYAEHY